MKILTLGASNSSQSINKALVSHAGRVIEGGLIPDATVEVIDLNDYEMPIYSMDREAADGVPQLAKDFYAKLGEADAVIISFAEHNGSYTAAYKNLFDWTSRISQQIFQDTPSVYLATSPGPGGAGSVLAAAVNSAQFFGTEVVASLSIPSFFENFDPTAGELTNPDLSAQLEQALAALDSASVD